MSEKDATQTSVDQESTPLARAKRLKRARNMANLTRKELCEGNDININSLKGWEIGRYGGLSKSGALKVSKRLAEAGVDCSVDWLLYNIGSPPAIMKDLDSDQMTDQKFHQNISDEKETIIQEVHFFRQNNPNSLVLEIEDEGMSPQYKMGDFVAGIKLKHNQFHLALGHICIVQMKNGKTLLRRVLKGKTQNSFTLISDNNQFVSDENILNDVELINIAPVLWHRCLNTFR